MLRKTSAIKPKVNLGASIPRSKITTRSPFLHFYHSTATLQQSSGDAIGSFAIQKKIQAVPPPETDGAPKFDNVASASIVTPPIITVPSSSSTPSTPSLSPSTTTTTTNSACASKNESDFDVIIVGGGLVGTCLAATLGLLFIHAFIRSFIPPALLLSLKDKIEKKIK